MAVNDLNATQALGAGGDAVRPPNHVAIIMDGNGRWAKRRGLPRIAGHHRGVAAVREIVEAADEFGVRYLTLYAFSSENWKRPVEEVSGLMLLFRRYIQRELADLNRRGVRMRFIGDRARLSRELVTLIDKAEAATAGNQGLNLIVAVNYGSKNEIVGAVRALAQEVAAGRLAPDAIDDALIAARLDTAGVPDPDVVIRTSGERRISNFLLWQAAYAEFVFHDALWPDFTRAHLAEAIDEYHRRDRRFGASQ